MLEIFMVAVAAVWLVLAVFGCFAAIAAFDTNAEDRDA